MKKQVRILSAVCAAACAVSALAMPAAASYVETTTEPLAKVIRDLRTREDIFLNEKTSYCEYWNAEQWELITYRRISYPITIKAGTYDYDTVKAKLTELLTCRTPGSFVISDTEKNEYGNTATAYLLADGDTLTLSIDPTLFSMDESALLSYLQTLPGFVSVQYDLVGFYESDIPRPHSSNFSEWATFYVYVQDSTILQLSDFPEDLCVTTVEKASETTDGIYRVVLDTEKRKGSTDAFTLADAYPCAEEIKKIPQVTVISVPRLIADLYVDETPYLIDNGAIPLMTRGSCSGGDTLSSADAAVILQDAASTGAGLDETLSGTARIAADVNGDGKVNAQDAAYLLSYCAQDGAGLQPTWEALLG